MKLFLAIPTMNAGLLTSCLQAANDVADEDPNAIIHLNGIDYDLLRMSEVGILGSFNHMVFTGSGHNIGVVPALESIYQALPKSREDDIIAYIHDDVILQEGGWDTKILRFFDSHKNVGLAGFFGATGLADPMLYKKPYELTQLARRGCFSNMQDAEAHGSRTASPMRVATVDGFSMVVRRRFLDQIGGWSWWPPQLVHHSYDNALACMAARHGWETWLLPMACHHMGGQTSTRVNFLSEFGKTEGQIHSDGHDYLYNEFSDVLPLSF